MTLRGHYNLRKSISQRQGERSTYPPRDAAEIISQVLKGLESFHKLNFVHRDIKPENIYNSGGIWKLGDYGGVRSQHLLGELSSRGTLYYRAPEVRPDAKDYLKIDRDYRLCDIYSVGLILRELLTLENYWELQSSPKRPPTVDTSIWIVALKSIEKEPKD